MSRSASRSIPSWFEASPRAPLVALLFFFEPLERLLLGLLRFFVFASMSRGDDDDDDDDDDEDDDDDDDDDDEAGDDEESKSERKEDGGELEPTSIWSSS